MELVAAYLILGHLLADFVIQPLKLVIWKNRSMWGLSVHVLVHFALYVLLLSPLIFNGNYWLFYPILGISLVHFWIDQGKIVFERKKGNKKNRVKPFIYDQFLHFLTIFLALYFASETPLNPLEPSLYTRFDLVLFLILLIIFTSVLDVLDYESRLETNPKAKIHLYSHQSLTRGLILTLLYLIVNLGG